MPSSSSRTCAIISCLADHPPPHPVIIISIIIISIIIIIIIPSPCAPSRHAPCHAQAAGIAGAAVVYVLYVPALQRAVSREQRLRAAERAGRTRAEVSECAPSVALAVGLARPAVCGSAGDGDDEMIVEHIVGGWRL